LGSWLPFRTNNYVRIGNLEKIYVFRVLFLRWRKKLATV
jgi:hypothetical protein